MEKKTSLGTSSFREVIENDYYYVDKTLLVKHILEGFSVNLLLRPRRFGKTLNMSMLSYFFDKSQDNAHLFEGLAVRQDEESWAHQGKYPVIFFSLKEVKKKNWQDMRADLCQLIYRLWAEHPYLAGAPVYDKTFALIEKEVFSKIVNESYIAKSLKTLCELLEKHHGAKVVMLIDEYDTPVQTAWLNSFYQEAVDFMRTMLGAALKDNDSLAKGVLTGILRVSKESMFSDLNNFWASTALDSDAFGADFGFTEPEVVQMLDYYRLNGAHLQEIKDWYDGYRYGRHTIFNPWSVLNYVHSEEHKAEPYWVNTSENALLRQLFFGKGANIRSHLRQLMAGEKIRQEVDKHLVFQEMETSEAAIWTMLILAGYLRVENQQRITTWELSVPNYEVHHVFVTTVTKWLTNDVKANTRKPMLEALLSGDVRNFERYFSGFVVQVFSYHDTAEPEPEAFYHAFLLGLIAELEDRYHIRSNRESGFGRFDIALFPKKRKQKAVLIELKSPDTHYGETLEEALAEAERQALAKKYETEFRRYKPASVFRLAIAVSGKTVKIKEMEEKANP